MNALGLEFKSMFDLLRVVDTEQKCVEQLENILWKGKLPTSPFDPNSKVYKCKTINTNAKTQDCISQLEQIPYLIPQEYLYKNGLSLFG